jgi:hypothetical protein
VCAQLLRGEEQGQAEGIEATYEDRDNDRTQQCDSSAHCGAASAPPGAQVEGRRSGGARLLS